MSEEEERSDEWKVVSYVGERYDAVTSIQPSFTPAFLRSSSDLTLILGVVTGVSTSSSLGGPAMLKTPGDFLGVAALGSPWLDEKS